MKKAILLLILPLSACTTVVGLAIDGAYAVANRVSEMTESSGGDEPPCTLRYTLSSVCIEYNRDTAIPDFVPALQKRLRNLKVESTLYSPAAMPSTCDATLRYQASRGWKNNYTSTDVQPYLEEADLSLIQGGKMISSSRYQISRMGTEKWNSTASKMSPVVDDLLCVRK